MTVPRRRGLALAAALAVVAVVSQGLVSPTRGAETPVAPLVAPGAWTATSTLSTVRSLSTVTTLDGPACRAPNATPPAWCGKVLAAAGRRGADGVLGSAELYDPTTGYWSPTGAMLAPRHSHTATLLDGARCRLPTPPAHCGKVLVTGGAGGANEITPFDSAELYDPATGTWSPTGAMTTAGGPRALHTAAALDGPRCRGILSLPVPAPDWCGKVLVVGGINNLKKVTNTTRQLNEDPAGFFRFALATAALYDPATGTWGATGNLALGRYAHTLTSIDGGPCRSGALPVAPVYCGRVLIAGGAIAAAGVRQGYTESEVYDPDVGRWIPTGPAAVSRLAHAAVLLDGPACRGLVPALYCNKVLVAGGITANNVYNPPSHPTAELYDPASGMWSTTGPMGTGRSRSHTMTVLDGAACRSQTPPAHCGKVLTTGGADKEVSVSGGSPELYDPLLGVFALTGRQLTRASGNAVLIDGTPCHTQASAPPLNCGRVLVSGGGGGEEDSTGEGGPSAELFDGSALSQPPSVRSVDPASAPSSGGVSVALTGAGLTGATEVRFGEVAAPHFTVESPTRIVATSPSQAPGVVDVTVRGPSGTSAAINLTRLTVFRPTHEWATTGARVSTLIGPTLTTLLDGRVLAAGGKPPPPGNTASASSEVFDPVTGRWDPTDNPLSTPRREHTATRLANGEVLVVGGAEALRSAEVFNPTTGTWRATGSLEVGRGWHTATLLRSGKVLVAGGFGSGILASAELYDPLAIDAQTGAQGAWTTIASLNAIRQQHHAALLGDGRVLVASGLRTCCHDGSLTSAEVYDPADPGAGWKPTGSLATKRRFHTLTALTDGRVLVAGGCTPDSPCNSGTGQPEPAEIYEPDAVDPATGARGAWRAVAGMGVARHDHSATLLDGPGCGALCGSVLMVGGTGISGPMSSAELFDPVTESWVPALSMATARKGHRSVLMTDGRVLAVGGERSQVPTVLRSAEIFGVVAHQRPPVFTVVDPPAGPSGTRVRIRGTGLSGTTIVNFGGIQVVPVSVTEYMVVAVSPDQARGTVEVTVTTPLATSVNNPKVATDDFAYTSGRWRAGPSMSTERYLHTSTLLDGPNCREPVVLPPPAYCGKVLVAGGTTNYMPVTVGAAPAVPHRSAELYDPAATSPDGAPGSWSLTTDMAAPHFDHTATLLDGPECHTGGLVPAPPHCGKVLVVGGEIAFFAIPVTELYDPMTQTWAPAGLLAQARFSHTATLLADGRVLVAGGGDLETTRNGLTSAEIYDPARGTWTTVSPLTSARNSHTATLLPNGRVLVAGGLAHTPTADNHILNEAEVYDPVANTWTPVEPMAVNRFSHTATLLGGPGCGNACGKVLVVGGVNTADPTEQLNTFHASAELFDPATGSWSPTLPHGTARAGHTATLLPNGTVLVAGSAMTFYVPVRPAPLASAEVYDPVSGRWSFTEVLAAPRGMHGADLLDGPACRRPAPPAYCGTVLVSGGATVGSLGVSNQAPIPLSSSEIYSPAPDVSGVKPSIGPNAGGAPVVITGTLLSGATAVRFGEVPAPSFTIDSPTQITAVSPQTSGVGPVQVIIEGPGGTSALQRANPAALFTYVGLPGAIASVVARALSDTAIELSFAAAHNGDGSTPAQDYVIKQSPEEITEANFDAADAVTLCDGRCHIQVPALSYRLGVDNLEPGRTYHYALRAVNDQGRGPMSNDASATTGGVADRLAAPACPALPVAGAGSVVYPGGRYSLIGLPGDTVVGSDSPLYGWSDLGAGGAYSVLAAFQPVTGGKGYWAWFACPRAVDMGLPAAGDAASASFALGAYHASMVGNPSATSPATVTGHDFAARWDPALNDGAGGYGISGYREPQTLAVGEGIWTFSYVPTTITILADH